MSLEPEDQDGPEWDAADPRLLLHPDGERLRREARERQRTDDGEEVA